MKLFRLLFRGPDFSELDRSIARLRVIRDSYRVLNIEIYGEEIANLLNDW